MSAACVLALNCAYWVGGKMSLGSGFIFGLRAFRTPRNLGSSHEKPGLRFSTFPRFGYWRRPDDAASYLVFCGPEDAVGTLLGVLKHILASHARACRAKTRETIEARQQGHLPAISGRRRRGRAQPLCARLKEPSQHSPKATTASVRPRRRRGRATPRARATERSHDHARHAPLTGRAPGHRRGHR